MLIGGALANPLAFTGSSYLFQRLSADNIDAERKRHDRNRRSFVLSQELNYITSCNIITFWLHYKDLSFKTGIKLLFLYFRTGIGAEKPLFLVLVWNKVS